MEELGEVENNHFASKTVKEQQATSKIIGLEHSTVQWENACPAVQGPGLDSRTENTTLNLEHENF